MMITFSHQWHKFCLVEIDKNVWHIEKRVGDGGTIKLYVFNSKKWAQCYFNLLFCLYKNILSYRECSDKMFDMRYTYKVKCVHDHC